MRWKDKRGVSPVIGVILMVAITVILAAVIASFVFGMGSKVKSAPQASFMLEDNSSSIKLTNTSQPLFDAMLYGGGPLKCGELRITIKDLNTSQTYVLNWNTTDKNFTAPSEAVWGNTSGKAALSPGDKIVFYADETKAKIYPGDPLEMIVLHIPTGTIIYDGRVVVY